MGGDGVIGLFTTPSRMACHSQLAHMRTDVAGYELQVAGYTFKPGKEVNKTTIKRCHYLNCQKNVDVNL